MAKSISSNNSNRLRFSATPASSLHTAPPERAIALENLEISSEYQGITASHNENVDVVERNDDSTTPPNESSSSSLGEQLSPPVDVPQDPSSSSSSSPSQPSEASNASTSSVLSRYLKWNTVKTLTIFTLLVTIVFGVGAWVGQRQSNNLSTESTEIAKYSLCADHEVGSAFSKYARSNLTFSMKELRATAKCKEIMAQSLHALSIDERHLGHPVIQKREEIKEAILGHRRDITIFLKNSHDYIVFWTKTIETNLLTAKDNRTIEPGLWDEFRDLQMRNKRGLKQLQASKSLTLRLELANHMLQKINSFRHHSVAGDLSHIPIEHLHVETSLDMEPILQPFPYGNHVVTEGGPTSIETIRSLLIRLWKTGFIPLQNILASVGRPQLTWWLSSLPIVLLVVLLCWPDQS